MGTIRIHDLNFRSIIGAYSWERTNKQDVIVNLTLEYDSSKAAKSDRLKDALDYEVLAQKIGRIVEGSRYQLLEKLAAKVMAGIMADKRVQWAKVRLEKPHAIAHAQSVSFELESDGKRHSKTAGRGI